MTSNKKHNDVQDFASYIVGSHLNRFKEILNPPKPQRGLLDFVTEELVRIEKKQSRRKKKA